MELTEEQKRIGQMYSGKAMDAIHDADKFDAVMKEFEAWKEKEGIEI